MYTVIDIETTGLKCREGAEITEIAGINVDDDGNIITTFSSLCNIEGNISDFIENLTGINNNMVKNAPKLGAVLLKFLYVLNIEKDTNLVIHNAKFDYEFIMHYAEKEIPDTYIKKLKECNVICSLEMARKLLPNESHKLDYLKEKFGIKAKNHRALTDVMITNKIYQELLKIENSLNI